MTYWETLAELSITRHLFKKLSLREENQKLRNDLEVLTAENERLEASKESDFMLLGAGLVFGGVLLALIIPMLKPTRKTDNWA